MTQRIQKYLIDDDALILPAKDAAINKYELWCKWKDVAPYIVEAPTEELDNGKAPSLNTNTTPSVSSTDTSEVLSLKKAFMAGHRLAYMSKPVDVLYEDWLKAIKVCYENKN